MAYTKPEKTWTASDVLTAAQLNTYLRDQLDVGFPDGATSTSWTPELQSTGGAVDHTTTKTGREWQVGPIQFAWVRWVISSVGDSGTLYVQLPTTTAVVDNATNSGQAIGSFQLFDADTTLQSITGTVILTATGQARFYIFDGGTVTDTTPFTLANGDVLSMQVAYPVA